MPLLAGGRLNTLSNYYSSLYKPLVFGAGETAVGDLPVAASVWQAVARAIRQHPARWPVLMLDPLDPQSAFFTGMRDGLRSAGYAVDAYFCFGNWYLQVNGRSFADYFSALPSPLRHSIERGRRRLTRQGVWGIEIHQTLGAALDAAIQHFETVYRASWKGQEPNAAFIPALARMAAQRGWLRLGVLQLDGQPIAAQLWLAKDGKANIFKLAYVSGFERFSAGSVLTAALMQHAIDIDQVHEVDYLTGDDGYKRDWMSHRRERWGLVAFDWRTPTGFWAASRHWLGKLRKLGRGVEKVTMPR
ncbi:hypothetical protein RA876_00540 [Rhodoferax antarcticus]|nr:hypothetical protein RA876_00540 [Rhodoferax antarcticus]